MGLNSQPCQAQAGGRGQSLEVEPASFLLGAQTGSSFLGVPTKGVLYFLPPLTSAGDEGRICWVFMGRKHIHPGLSPLSCGGSAELPPGQDGQQEWAPMGPA